MRQLSRNFLAWSPQWRSGDFESQQGYFGLFRKTFAVDVETVPVQLELTELDCNGAINAKNESATIPQLRLYIISSPVHVFSTNICISV